MTMSCGSVPEVRESDRHHGLLVLTATYNEAENVERMAEEVLRHEPGADFLFVDDNSPDGTGQILERMARENPQIHVLHRPTKLGIGTAHADGIRWAYRQGYRNLVTLDCDFTHPPRDIPRLIEAGESWDLVVASRHMERGSLEGWQPHRVFLTKSAYLATRYLLGMPFDATGAFRFYRLDRIPEVWFEQVRSPGYSFFLESLYVLWTHGARVRQIPVRLPARAQGKSKMRPADAWQSVKTVLRLARGRL